MATTLYCRDTTTNAASGPSAEQSTAMPGSGATASHPTLTVQDLKDTLGASQVTFAHTHPADTSHHDGCMRIFVSDALAAGTIDANTWTFGLSGLESNGAADTFHNVIVYVWRPSNSTVVGFAVNAHEGSTWGVEILDTSIVATATGSQVTGVQAGDRLVFEWWHHWLHTMAVAYTSDIRYNGSVAVTSTTGNGSWIETPQNNLFGGTDATPTPGATSTTVALPQASAGVPAVTEPTAVTVPATLPGPSIAVAASPATIGAVASLPSASPAVGTTVAPAAVPAPVALPQASAGVATIVAPAATTAPVTLPAVSAAVSTSPAVITAAVALPAVGVNVAASPAVLAALAALPQVTVAAGGSVTVSPAAVGVATSLPRPGINIAAGPSSFAAVAALPAAGVTVSPFATPAPIAVLVGLATPVVVAGGGATPTPAAIAVAAAFYVPFAGDTPVVIGPIPVTIQDAAGVTFTVAAVAVQDPAATVTFTTPTVTFHDET